MKLVETISMLLIGDAIWDVGELQYCEVCRKKTVFKPIIGCMDCYDMHRGVAWALAERLIRGLRGVDRPPLDEADVD